MQDFEKILEHINTFLWSYCIIAILIITGIYFSIKTRFVQIRFLKQMIPLLLEKDSKSEGMSSLQAFAVSTATRVGTGNIAGVAIAIAIGGAGAVFWMWLLALLGAATSFAETVLGQIYKRKINNEFVGGPAYYIKYALGNKKLSYAMAIITIITFGLAFPAVASNTVSDAFTKAFHIPKFISAIFMFSITLIVIFNGRNTILNVIEKILPLMAFLYIGLVCFVIITNLSVIPHIFQEIIAQGLGFKPFIGGTFGVTLMQGIRRGLFSNEAGIGSSPNASSSADISHPVKQGIVQSLSVFIDTIVICTFTALLILIAQDNTPTQGNGIILVQNTLIHYFGIWGSYFMAICIFLFAYSTILGDFFYTESNLNFLNCKRRTIQIAGIITSVVVAIATITTLESVITAADLSMGIMGLTNIYAILRLSQIVYRCLQDYSQQKQKNLNPVFKAENIQLEPQTLDHWK